MEVSKAHAVLEMAGRWPGCLQGFVCVLFSPFLGRRKAGHVKQRLAFGMLWARTYSKPQSHKTYLKVLRLCQQLGATLDPCWVAFQGNLRPQRDWGADCPASLADLACLSLLASWLVASSAAMQVSNRAPVYAKLQCQVHIKLM